MGTLIPFKPLAGLSTPFDGWDKQCHHILRDFSGGRDVWGFLIEKFGLPARQPQFLVALLGPFVKWLQEKELALSSDFVYSSVKRSLIAKYGQKEFPLNVLLYVNDHLKWTPDEFRTAYLKWEFERLNVVSKEEEEDD